MNSTKRLLMPSSTTSSSSGRLHAQISDETRAAAPEIPWAKVIALRNFIAHQYFRVDLEIIRDIVKQELDELDVVAARLIAEEGSEGT
jgi:uncharacterized protein with HEPN domain